LETKFLQEPMMSLPIGANNLALECDVHNFYWRYIFEGKLDVIYVPIKKENIDISLVAFILV
jgi:hypothetical protein